MDVGTTFTFVTDGPESALAQATINQYLSLGAIDELRLHIVPITLGAGERIFDGVRGLTLDIGGVRPTDHVVHVTLRPLGE
jgi:dihydrofolate reductase